MKKKRNIAIVLGITDSWAFAAGTVLIGLRNNIRHEYDVIIYQQRLSNKNKLLLNRIHPCKFIDYRFKLTDPSRFTRVSCMSFSRYECYKLVEKYKKVLWLDSDVLIKGDISGLFHNYNHGIAMFRHNKIPVNVSFSMPVPGFDMKRDCLNAGIFLLNHDLKKPDKLRNWCYEKTNIWSKKINSDQAIINLLIQKFKLRVMELPEKYNCNPNHETANTLIIHPWGNLKFWNGYHHPLWDSYFAQWKKIGGDGPKTNIRKRLVEIVKKLIS